MFTVKPAPKKTPDNGYTRPVSGAVSDPFGPRAPFEAHVASKGYSYDWHRGVDFAAAENDPIKAPMGGSVVRKHYTHFLYWHTNSLNEFTEEDADGAIVASVDTGILDLAWTANLTPSGTTFLAASKLILNTPIDPDSGDLDIRLRVNNPDFDGQGSIGVALIDTVNSEYAAVDFDSSTVTCHAVDADGVDATSNAATASVGTLYWLRLFYDQSADELYFQYGTDGFDDGGPTSWTTVSTWAGPNWTKTGLSASQVCLYFRRTTSSPNPSASGTLSEMQLTIVDNETIGRFGNWVEIQRNGEAFFVMHMSHISVGHGPIQAGEVIGTTGRTGYDAASGYIQTPHVHVEHQSGPDANYFYAQDDVDNPLAAGIFPRADVSNNVVGVLTEGVDPNDDDCHILTVTVTRADDDFDLNTITLTGNLASRTINYNTRAGLNTTDDDIPDYDGVYISPSAFDENSTTNVVSFYFQKDVVGNSVQSWELQDTSGQTLDSFDSGLDLTNAVIWLDAQEGVTTGTGTNVVSWTDKINSVDFVNAADDATCPDLQAADINGLNSILFVRANSTKLVDLTQASSLWPSTLYPAYTMALVNLTTNVPGNVNGQAYFGISGGNTPTAASGMLSEVASTSEAQAPGAAIRSILTNGNNNTLSTTELTNSLTPGQWHVVEGGINTTPAAYLQLDNNPRIGPTGAHQACGNPINNMTVGCYLYTQVYIWHADMRIVEIFAFDAIPSETQTAKIRTYWANKYAL